MAQRPSKIVANIVHTTAQRAGAVVRKSVTVNSLADLKRLHDNEMASRTSERTSRLSNALTAARQLAGGREVVYTRNDKGERVPMTRNLGATDMIRTEFLRFLLDGPRDIDAECGYPSWLTPDHYKAMYDREGAAKRVVECEPDETWAMDPEVYDDEDPNNETPFEKAWKKLLKKHNLWHHLHRIDVLSGIGQFGILLIGIDDGKDLCEPVEGLNDDGTIEPGNEYKLLYLRPFSEEVVFVKTREVDINNPRYGLPTRYTIQFRDFPNWGIQAGEIVARDVHWTRVIHVADNLKMSPIYGVPRMQQVWNRLYDLRKVYAASGEAFWKGAFPGFAFEVNPELADQGIEIDKESVKKEMEAYANGTQRYMATTGVTTKTLPPQVADPTPSVETHLKGIAIAKAIPYRILFGSEEAKLAGNSDTRAWNKRMAKRQTKYVTPMIVRPFIDRLIALGVLPQPGQGVGTGEQITRPNLLAPPPPSIDFENEDDTDPSKPGIDQGDDQEDGDNGDGKRNPFTKNSDGGTSAGVEDIDPTDEKEDREIPVQKDSDEEVGDEEDDDEEAEYFIDWPDLNAPTDLDKAQIANTVTQALQAYVVGGISQIMTPQDYLTRIIGLTKEEADAVLDNAELQADQDQVPSGEEGELPTGEDDLEGENEDDEEEEGALGGIANPNQGNALMQRELSRQDTVGWGKKRKGKQVEAQLVEQPNLNSRVVANTIKKRKDGYYVLSEKSGKNLGGPYKSRGEAERRLKQVEYFKRSKPAGK